jgi:PKHD-type hydroxylase
MERRYVFPQEEADLQNYYWYAEGFNKEELDRVEKGVAKLPFVQAGVAKENSIDKKIRSSSIKWVPQNEEWLWLYEKMMNMAVEANNALWHFDLFSIQDSIQYTEYYATEDGHYGWHQDIGPGWLSNRKVSITVQLAAPDEYEGGNLDYWQGGEGWTTAARGKGTVFIFPSYMMHRVSPVTKGTRKSFVLWVGGGHYK